MQFAILFFVFANLLILHSLQTSGARLPIQSFASMTNRATAKSYVATYNPAKNALQISKYKFSKDTNYRLKKTSKETNSIYEFVKEELAEEVTKCMLTMAIRGTNDCESDPGAATQGDTLSQRDQILLLKNKGYTVDDVIGTLRDTPVQEKIRMITNVCNDESLPDPAATLSMNELNLYIPNIHGKFMVMFKTANSVKRTECSLLVGEETLIYPSDSVTTTIRSEIPVDLDATNSCSYVAYGYSQKTPVCKVGTTYYNGFTRACNGDLQCTNTVYHTMCATYFMHTTSYKDRRCSDIPLQDLCAFKSPEYESKFIYNFIAASGSTDICIREFSFTGAATVPYSEVANLTSAEQSIRDTFRELRSSANSLIVVYHNFVLMIVLALMMLFQ